MVVTKGVKGKLWLLGLLDDLGIKQECMDLSYDFQIAVHLAKNKVHHAFIKNINVIYHFVQNFIEECNISIDKVHINENLANTLTKVLLDNKFHH